MRRAIKRWEPALAGDSVIVILKRLPGSTFELPPSHPQLTGRHSKRGETAHRGDGAFSTRGREILGSPFWIAPVSPVTWCRSTAAFPSLSARGRSKPNTSQRVNAEEDHD